MKGDDEIIKAANICASGNDIEKCVNCPFFGDYKDCKDRLIVGLNDLARRLKKQNKKLKNKGEEKL